MSKYTVLSQDDINRIRLKLQGIPAWKAMDHRNWSNNEKELQAKLAAKRKAKRVYEEL